MGSGRSQRVLLRCTRTDARMGLLYRSAHFSGSLQSRRTEWPAGILLVGAGRRGPGDLEHSAAAQVRPRTGKENRMEYFLGVDAGGTKTVFVLGDATRELARVRTGTIKRMKADAETAERNLQEGLRGLTDATGIAPESIAGCCIGTAGETVALVTNWLRE